MHGEYLAPKWIRDSYQWMDKRKTNLICSIYLNTFTHDYCLDCFFLSVKYYQERSAYRTRPDPKVLLLYKLDIFIHTFVS